MKVFSSLILGRAGEELAGARMLHLKKLFLRRLDTVDDMGNLGCQLST